MNKNPVRCGATPNAADLPHMLAIVTSERIASFTFTHAVFSEREPA